MPITQADVRLYQSERMTDNLNGGGRMSNVVVVDGQDNNVFPDVTDIDRLNGRTSLRKIFGAVISNDNDQYLSAHSLLDDAPDDVSTSALLFSYGELMTERAATIAAFETTPIAAADGGINRGSPGVATSGSADITGVNLAFLPVLGDAYLITQGAKLALRTLTSVAGTVATLNSAVQFSGTCLIQRIDFTNTIRCYGNAAVVGTLSASATTATVSTTFAAAAPYGDSSPPPTAAPEIIGVDWTKYTYSAGKVPVIKAGDSLLIHNTVAMAPATVSNGQTVNVSRTTLSRLRVIGNNLVEHARFTRGVAAPSGVGCTADLDAGTVTFSDVSGMSQPVTVEHRIEEMALAASVVGETITFNRGITRAYGSGTKISSLLLLGDLQGRIALGFAQQAWTGTWSDSRIGGEPLADFNNIVYPITTTNKGAVSQRWSVIFSNTTAFRIIGETLGEVGTGNTGGACSPNNPATGAPYFTIPAAGWGASWSAGNVYRFNTAGAQAPLWALRCVSPSVPGGDDSVTVEFRGYVNA